MVLITFKLLRHHAQGNFKSLFGAYSFSKLKSMTIMAGSMAAGRTHARCGQYVRAYILINKPETERASWEWCGL